MVALNSFNNTTLGIINNRKHTAEQRPYLGGSQIGHSCARYLWYSFRWCFSEQISNRLYRLFNRGHAEEDIFIENLRYAGVHCYGFQEEITFAYGHGKGHTDGLGLNVREAHKAVHLLEFKTMSNKYFNETKKYGVKQSKPIYYGQCQTYMHNLSGVERTLFCAVNKDTDEYYFERLKYDKGEAEMLDRKAKSIVLADVPPKKLKDDPTWWECKFCAAANICHHGAQIEQSCRTCVNMGIEQDGWWSCGQHGIYLSNSQQKLMCSEYQQQEM